MAWTVYETKISLGEPRSYLSRALRQLHVIRWSFDWFTVLLVPFVIGYSDYFGFALNDSQLKSARYFTPKAM